MTEDLKALIIEQVEVCKDTDLLDLIHKLLLAAECGDDLLNAGVLAG